LNSGSSGPRPLAICDVRRCNGGRRSLPKQITTGWLVPKPQEMRLGHWAEPGLERRPNRAVIGRVLASGARPIEPRSHVRQLIWKRMASGFKPPIPKRPAWMAYAVVFPLLALAFVTSPVWMAMFAALKAVKTIKAASRQHRIRSGRNPMDPPPASASLTKASSPLPEGLRHVITAEARLAARPYCSITAPAGAP
jgi:hypothetical protein